MQSKYYSLFKIYMYQIERERERERKRDDEILQL